MAIWCVSAFLISLSFFAFDGGSPLKFIASVIGITALLLCAKGNPIGQLLVIVFSVLYAVISYSFAYYGEMITYVGMSGPMAVLALISWLRNPYEGKRSEVKVNSIGGYETVFLSILSIAVTVAFYFILKHFETANLIPSTISVLTSFVAVYLTFRRSPYYAVAYAVNDVVLMILWSLAAFSDISYLSVVICFAAFLINDIYGFYSWQKMKKRQTTPAPCQENAQN